LRKCVAAGMKEEGLVNKMKYSKWFFH